MMKKISNWTLLGVFVGINLSLLSAIRYFVLYPDLDRAIIYIIIGLLIVGVAWLYNKNLQLSHTVMAVEDYLADLKVEKKK